MVEYRRMREGLVLTSCLHGGPIRLSEVAQAETRPSWLERTADLPVGTVARLLKALCREYGSCGVMAIDGDAVIGKVRFAPAGLGDSIPECCQQYPEAMAAFDPSRLPALETLQPRSLRVWCLQVVDEDRYRRQGIATTMVKQTLAWARETGWETIEACAVVEAPPLLNWTGLFSLGAYRRLGFKVTGSKVSPELLEAVRHMRIGGHGEKVREQWQAFAHLSEEEAATLWDVVLDLKEPPADE